MPPDFLFILKDVHFLMQIIWPRAKDRIYHGKHWVKGHIGYSVNNCSYQDLKVLRYLLAFKARDGECPITEHRLNKGRRRKEAMPHPAAWRTIRLRLIAEAGNMCQDCKKVYPTSKLTIDHVKPIFEGGTSDPENLRVLCEPCHRKKTLGEEWKNQRRFRKHFLKENIRLAHKYYAEFQASKKAPL